MCTFKATQEKVPHDVIGQAKYIGASTCFKVKLKIFSCECEKSFRLSAAKEAILKQTLPSQRIACVEKRFT